jgi:hypothetical protein
MAKKNDDTRPTASSYLLLMKELQNQMFKLDMVVVTRLYSLCASYPDAPINVLIDDKYPLLGKVDIKAASLISPNRSKDFIKSLPFEERIQYIDAIEKWLADQQKHVQTKMFES